jgi:hypothetical protein
MTIGGWIYNRIISDANTNGIINGNCFPDILDYTTIPSVMYNIISQKRNIIIRSPIISIVGIEQSQDKCEILNEYLYNLFDDTTTVIHETSSNLKIESIEISNNIPSYYDYENKVWACILDIKLNYIK